MENGNLSIYLDLQVIHVQTHDLEVDSALFALVHDCFFQKTLNINNETKI